MNYHKQVYKRISFLLLCALAGGAVVAQKPKKEVKTVEVSIRVVNESGKQIPEAEIVVGEGFIHSETNQDGKFQFKARRTDVVTISEPGYEKVIIPVSQLLTNEEVELKTSSLYRTEDDKIALPYASTYKRNATGDYFVITGKELEKYPSLDLRNALAGLIPGLSVTELDGSTGLSAEENRGQFGATNRVNTYMRGKSPLFMVDDMPMDISEMSLDPDEIETITFIKDIVGKTMYGPQAANGVVFIKTKRGKNNERVLNVHMESGLSAVDRFPDWVSGTDYALLNNKARQNNGMAPLYDDAALAGYAKNDPYDKIYPNVNFKEMMFKDIKSFQRFNLSSTGGGSFAKYYAYLGYDGEGDNFKMGSDANYNRINARANLDMQVNNFLNVQVDIFGGLTIRNSPNYGYSGNYGKDNSDDAELDIMEFKSAIDEATTVPSIAFPIYADFDPETGDPWYGVSSNYKYNPIGNLVDNGYYSEKGRLGVVNISLDYDMSHLLKGLKSRTHFGFNTYNLTRIGKAERYAAYTVTPNADKTDVTLTKIQDPVNMSGQGKLHDYFFQRLMGYQTFSYNRSFDQHDIVSALTYNISKFTRNQVENPLCEQNANLMAGYTYAGKYSLQGAVTFAGTQSLLGANQYRFFPSVGASWVVSDEAFMEDISFLDFLKIRAEYGELGYQSTTPSLFQYENKWGIGSGDKFGPNSSNQWMGNQAQWAPSTTSYNKLGNPNLNWETRKEFSAGIDLLLLQRRLSVNVTYYNTLQDSQWGQPDNQFPLTTGLMAVPYMNYNQTRYYGAELSARFTDKIGDLRYAIGAMATLPRSTYVRYDEPKYKDDYQFRQGLPTDAYFGLVYDGRFSSDEETTKVPQLFDESLQKGDLKYVDQNGDGVIDNNDMKQIGNTSARVYYALNLYFAYKGFELTVIADGKAGYDVALTNRYFQNGWGDNTYSAFVRDNIDGDYPRLTYNKVNNNFQASDYWLRNGAYFKIQNVELAYNWRLPASIGLRQARFFVRGANLATISGIKDVDPESINAGVDRYPLNKTFTAGVKLTF